MRVRITFNEEMLGMSPPDKDVYRKFISSKCTNLEASEKEAEYISDDISDEDEESAKCPLTVFPHDENGVPFLWDYQIKGALKEKFKFLIMAYSKSGYSEGSECYKFKSNYKKAIDGNLFIYPRQIKIKLPDGEKTGITKRILRANTPKGERTTEVWSESVPAGSTMEFDIWDIGGLTPGVIQALNLGENHGLGQWRNSGKGVFSWEEIK